MRYHRGRGVGGIKLGAVGAQTFCPLPAHPGVRDLTPLPSSTMSSKPATVSPFDPGTQEESK